MLGKEEIHGIWTPGQGLWTPWVKPVLFAFMDRRFKVASAEPISLELGWVPAPGDTP